MNCAGFEKWLYENPKEKTLPGEASAHLGECAKCRALWKVGSMLLDGPKEEERLFLAPQIRAALIKEAKKASAGRYRLPNFLEDSLIQALMISILIAGGIVALPKFVSLDRMSFIKPYLAPAFQVLNPIYAKLLSMFSISGGIYLFAFLVFAVVFSMEIYFKTIIPRPRYSMS